jgi:ABC-2 type transport system ATP-binding protein
VSIVEVTGLRRDFKSKRGVVTALDGVELRVQEGEIFGILGPNGAGKTTFIRILSTLLLPTSGVAKVAGFDVATQAEKVRPLINMASGGERSGYDFITARGNLWFYSQLYGISGEESKKRIDFLSSAMRLTEYLDKKLYTLSTGYKQRLTISRAFINDPRVVFMDEPTIGLDVMTAKHVRDFLTSEARNAKRTILLATHNMAESESICDRVAIIDRGKILACDTPDSLKKSFGAMIFSMEVKPVVQSTDLVMKVEGVKGATTSMDEDRETSRVSLVVEDEGAVEKARAKFESAGFTVTSTWRQEPTLEGVFVKLVGRGFAERETEFAA